MQQKSEVEAVTQQQSLAVVKNMIRTSVRLLDNIDRKISEICYLRNLFDEDCFCKKNYAGIMINALHPMDTKEGSEPHIHNSEAWQLTRWLEEGVFGELPLVYPTFQMLSKSVIFAVWSSRSTTIPRINPNPASSKRIPVLLPSLPVSLLDAFTYPDTQHIQLEVKQNNERSVVSTDGVKNQAVLSLGPFVSDLSGDSSSHAHHALQHALSSASRAMDHSPALLLRRHHRTPLLFSSLSQPPDYQPAYFEDTADSSIRPGDSSFISDPFVIEAGRLRTVLFFSLFSLSAIPRHVHESARHRIHAPPDRSFLPAHRSRDAGARADRRGLRRGSSLHPRSRLRGPRSPRLRIRAQKTRSRPRPRRSRSPSPSLLTRSAALSALSPRGRLRHHVPRARLGDAAISRKRGAAQRSEIDAHADGEAGVLRLAARGERGHRGGARASGALLRFGAA